MSGNNVWVQDIQMFDASGDVKTNSAGEPVVNTVVSDRPAQAESLYYSDTFTIASGTTTGAGTTSTGFCRALGYPWDTLVLTKSATNAAMTVYLEMTVSHAVITVVEAGTDTLDISAFSGATDLGNIIVRDSSGTLSDSSALVNGTYFIYLGK